MVCDTHYRFYHTLPGQEQKMQLSCLQSVNNYRCSSVANCVDIVQYVCLSVPVQMMYIQHTESYEIILYCARM